MEQEKDVSFYAIIPANVRYDKDLPANAKLLYGEITALCNKKGYCWSSNEYFANLYGVSKVSISNWVNLLVRKGYITSEIEYKDGTKEFYKRYLKIVYEPIKENFNTPIKENFNTPIKENFKENNTVFNNTIMNNTSDNKETINSKEKKLTEAQEIQKIIDDNFKYNNELYETYNEFNKMRNKSKKASNTLYANKQIINKLNKMTNDDNEKIEIINQSIINGWIGIFPLKKNNQYNNSNNKIPTIAGTGYESNSYNFEIPRDDEETNKYANMSEDEINF